MSFCPVCGKNILPGQEFCKEHLPIVVEMKPFEVIVCNCGRIKTHDRWFLTNDLEASLLKAAREHCKQKVSFIIDGLELPEKRGTKRECKITASFQGKEFPVTCTIKNQLCEQCAKRGTQFFTAKVQLRDPPEGVLEYIESFLEPLAEKGVSVNKVEDTPRGPDLYITHKSAARHLGEKLVRKFGGSMKAAEQLFSRDKQTSKDLYRLNVAVQFPLFKTGDVVSFKGRAVLVTGVGKQCTGRDLELDKKVVFAAGEEQEKLAFSHTMVSKTYPCLEVLHPATYDSVPVSNHESLSPAVKNGESVKVVVAGKKVFII